MFWGEDKLTFEVSSQTTLGDRASCFTIARRFSAEGGVSQAAIVLEKKAAHALASLLPLLGCGEEAATMAFEALSLGAATAGSDPAAALLAIAHEERVHDFLLRRLSAALPPATGQAAMLRAARRFHIDLGRGNSELHLAKIAGLDSAVCMLLSRLVRPDTPLAASSIVCGVLTRIRDDEARHVRVSRAMASAAGWQPALRQAAADSRDALASILLLGANSFEALAVDPDALAADVRRLPNGLFAP